MTKQHKLKHGHKGLQMQLPNDTLMIRDKMIIGVILMFTLFLFARVIRFEFTNWDDNDYVSDNPLITNLSLKGLIKIFTTPVIGMYNPLTFLVYTLEYALFGLDPKMFHLFNLLFHLAGVAVLYKFIYKLSGRYETAAIVALLFAVHPMHVSVVAWVSQTKTSLMFIFYILSLNAYLNYLKDPAKRKYLFYVAGYFILAALSKPDAVTLSPVLLLIDYYKGRKEGWNMLKEKIPFFAISLVFGLLTFYTHYITKDEIFHVKVHYTPFNQLLVTNYSVVFYINKLLVPLQLTGINPYPIADPDLPLKYYLSLGVLPLVGLFVYKAGKFRKEVIFGLLFFFISISVLIKFVPSGFFKVANRYSYLSYTGLFYIIGQGYVYLMDHKLKKSPDLKVMVKILLVIYVLFISYRVTIRVKTWENNISFYNDVIKKNPNVPVAYKNRGNAKVQLGDLEGAIKDYQTAFNLDTTDAGILNNLGTIKAKSGFIDEGLADINRAMKMDPELSLTYNNRAIIEYWKHDTLHAMQDWKKAASMGNPQAIQSIKFHDPEYYDMFLSKVRR